MSEIDANGANFPMFLNSLPKRQLESLSDWVEGLFNYRIALEPSGGHISINLVEGKSTTNIVDTGYGVSQILPVLGQIWWSTNQDTRRVRAAQANRVSMLAIEQPELHLHPAHQAMLADALISKLGASPTERANAPHFLVETHSEALVNRLGELVAKGKVKASDVQILVFSADDGDRSTSVRISQFGDDGVLSNWP